MLTVSEVEEAIYGYSVEKMAEEACKDKFSPALAMDYWKEGFNAHRELTKDKLFTIEDMVEAFNKGRFIKSVKKPITKSEIFDLECEGITYNPEEHYHNSDEYEFKDSKQFTQSLLPKTEWECTIDEQGKIVIL